MRAGSRGEGCGPGGGRGRRREGCTGRESEAIQPGRGREPGAWSRSCNSEAEALTAMGRGSRRALGSLALLLLLLLLRLPWPVWGAEAFRGEWESAPRDRHPWRHCQGMEDLKPWGCAVRRTGNREGLGGRL